MADNRHDHLIVARYLVLATCAAILSSVAVAFVWGGYEYSMGRLVGDDAGYYLGIARNHALGHGITFDRIHPTNGFNPLFQFVLIIVFGGLLPESPSVEACYKAGTVTSYAFFLASALIFYINWNIVTRESFGDSLRSRLLSACGLFVYVCFFAYKQIYGHDYAGTLLIMNLYLLVLLRTGVRPRNYVQALVHGIVLGLAVLTRLDLLVLPCVAFLVAVWLGSRDSKRLRYVPVALLATAAIVLPYVIWGYREFGTWVPVSAKMKTSFPIPDFALSMRLFFGGSMGISGKVAIGGAFGISVVVLLRHGGHFLRCTASFDLRRVDAALFVLSLYTFGRATVMLLFSKHDFQDVYMAFAFPYLLIGCLVLAAGLVRVRRHELRLCLLLLLLGATIQAYALSKYARSVQIYAGTEHQVRFSQEIQRRVQPDQVVFGGANGLMGFLADRKWINGDGVVNTHEYLRREKTPQSMRDYLTEERVEYVVTQKPEPDSGTVVYDQILRDRGSVRMFLVER